MKRTATRKARKAVVEIAHNTFHGGHPDFIGLCVDEMALHAEKNADYAGGAASDPLGNFTRVAAILALYPGLDPSDPAVVSEIYAIKQWDAYMWMKAKRYEGLVETKETRMRDRSVYAKLTMLLDRRVR